FQVWVIILVSVLVVGLLLWAMTEATGDWAPILYPHKGQQASPLKYIWDTGFGLTAQSNRMRLNESSRVLLGVWWTYCIILIYTYTGNLIAFLTVPRVAGIINSLEALANQKQVLWTYRAGTAHDKLFGSATSGTYHKIGQLMRDRSDLLVTSDEDGIDAVLYRHMAFIKEKSFLDFAMEQDYLETKQCRLTQVPQLFFSASFGWVLEEESVFLPLFNTEILRMMQTGLFRQWMMKYWPQPNECTVGADKEPLEPRALIIEDLGGHFIVLGLGSCCATIAFLLELIYSR
ncbi:Ionotropic glutamate receptor, partial [Trinorchestia longiramus]